MSASNQLQTNERTIAYWLLACCVLIFIMVVVGGATRLTRSGLSMVEWKPVTGVVPPLNEKQWLDSFEKYKQFPEYQKINKGMTLDEYKAIYWFEFGHRLLGRLIGIVFLLPFLYFLIRRKIPPQLTPKLVIMFILGGLQGLLGWYMVKSGLVDKPHVSQYRLAAHLMAAIAIYGFILWVALDLLKSKAKVQTSLKRLRKFSVKTTGLIVVMIFSGALVAGTKAGFVFNTFPLMGGQWLPPGGMSMQPWYLNLFENVATIQFTHRVIAVFIFLLIPFYWWLAKNAGIDKTTQTGFNVLLAMLVLQLTLGITTLVYVVPVPLGVAHQAGALALFTSALYLTHRLFNIR